MRIRIIAGGIFGNDGEYPIGTELEAAEVPLGWKSKVEVIKSDPSPDAVEVIKSDPSPDAVAVTNPKRAAKDAIGAADE